MSRASFLRGALGAGAALASSGFPAWSGIATAQPTDRRGLRGRVLLPGDAGYASAKQLFDSRFDANSPAAVVQVTSVEDVRAAVALAAESGLRIAPRGGGHSYVGASAADETLVIDLRELRDVRYDGGRVTVGAGASLSDVQNGLHRFGQTLPLGTCATVGITGLTLGGGIGIESRRHGLSCDRLDSAGIVLPNGELAETSATSDPDLFWALRGGGGQLGVVTSLTFLTCPATPKDVVRLTFPAERLARVITGWADWLSTADRSAWANIDASTDGHGTMECAVLLVCPADTGTEHTRTLTAATGTDPLTVQRQTLDHLEAFGALAGGSDAPRTCSVSGSDVVANISSDLADRIVETLTMLADAPGRVLIDPLDGAVRDLPSEATVFPWRDHAAVLQWIIDAPADTGHWIADAHRNLGSHSTGAYVNYLEPSDSPRRYFADNLDRLRRIRTAADPDNRLHPTLAL
ncbi:FAD-binding oxidoreductase [Nocardia sp. NPDC004604]|uniref:FAD-binding oxidoreductase n=1 Tax=Nocardia sp. NPDC004604 TaxID=3157013 RepID=UPI0033ACDBB7